MIRRFPGEDARITELKDYAGRHPAFRTDENIGDDTFFDRYSYRGEEDGGMGIRHNGEIRDRHIGEPRRSPDSPPNMAGEDIDRFFEYIEERRIKYGGFPSGVVGNSEVLLSEDEDFAV